MPEQHVFLDSGLVDSISLGGGSDLVVCVKTSSPQNFIDSTVQYFEVARARHCLFVAYS